MAKKRVIGEHINRKLKIFKILADRYRNRRKRFSLRFNLIAGLYNYELRLSFITNVDSSTATAKWIVTTYSQRNWVEVFYREAKGWLGLHEYQVRDKRSLLRHFILVFCAYTFILWHTLTGGLRRRWTSKPLNTFTDALEAFRTEVSFRFLSG